MKKKMPHESASMTSRIATGTPAHTALDMMRTASVWHSPQRNTMRFRLWADANRPNSATSAPNDAKPIRCAQGEIWMSGSAMATVMAACNPASAELRSEGWLPSVKMSLT